MAKLVVTIAIVAAVVGVVPPGDERAADAFIQALYCTMLGRVGANPFMQGFGIPQGSILMNPVTRETNVPVSGTELNSGRRLSGGIRVPSPPSEFFWDFIEFSGTASGPTSPNLRIGTATLTSVNPFVGTGTATDFTTVGPFTAPITITGGTCTNANDP